MSERLPVRRVVTGHDASGKAIVSMDGQPPHVIESAIPGTFFTEIWKTMQTPAPVDNGPDPTLAPRRMAPHPNGCAVRVVQIAPESQSKMPDSLEAMKAHFEEIGSPEAATSRAGAPHPLMHRTESVDFGIVLEGELTLILDDGEILLQPGDIVVQRGTNHAWSNRGNKTCRIIFILLDGAYDPSIKAALQPV